LIRRAHHLALAALVLSAVATLGCEWLFGLDDYTSRQCTADKKACPIAGEMKCVPLNDINTGCGRNTCAPCSYTHGYAACANEMCMMDGCQSGWKDCDPERIGCVTDLAHDAKNCNSCGHECTADHGWGGCSEGNCTIGGCHDGWRDCDGRVDNGCEAEVGDAEACPTAAPVQ